MNLEPFYNEYQNYGRLSEKLNTMNLLMEVDHERNSEIN